LDPDSTPSCHSKFSQQNHPIHQAEDWSLVTAGQRVQIMKKDPKKTGAGMGLVLAEFSGW
jgi:L-2-hydroxyglutarate oxidase LhgO